MKVKDATLKDVMKYGIHDRKDDLVCSMCGSTYTTWAELPLGVMLMHIVEEHYEDELPDMVSDGVEIERVVKA